MNRIVMVVLAGILTFAFHQPTSLQAATQSDEPLPNLTLTAPHNDGYRNYLGIQSQPGESFTFADIDADVLLIQLFSMYCPFCQEEAPAVNQLYEAMLDFSQSGYTVKIMGLGANNSDFEVDHYRNTYNVQFPLFADPDMKMYTTLGGKGTPGFIGCRKNKDNSYSIILRQSGGFYHVDEFLNELLRKSGYQ